jgi:hypothetical protein
VTIPRIPAGTFYALAGALLAGLLLRGCDHPHPIGPVVVVRTDTADAAAWRAYSSELERAMQDSVGRLAELRRRLRGVETRRPDRVTVYDTVVSLRTDTVLLSLAVDSRGRLAQDVALPDSAGEHRPAVMSPVYVGDCDDGLQLVAGRVQCDRPRLGHLVAWIGAGVESREAWGSGLPPPVAAHASVGLRWSPTWRSLWSAELRVEEDGRAVAAVRRGVDLW